MNFNFHECFEEISGHKPYQWQADLYDEWRSGIFRPIAIPTGLGKTSVMLVWLLALASQCEDEIRLPRIPRRFVVIVDRRTVVDQSTEVAEGLQRWLDTHPDHHVTKALASLSSKTHLPDGKALSISTLRGERADNGDWKRDPARPAIIIGTVYKIGSRLLFWGDGDGRTMRSMHAGLLGQDALLIHDEAHLSPAFGRLLQRIQAIQQTLPGPKPFHCVELTATPTSRNNEALRLPDADHANPDVIQRLCAHKVLHLHELDGEATPAIKRAAVVEKALEYVGTRKAIIVYVTSPDEASSIADELRKQAKACDVRLLTGTLRGYERDQLAGDPVFQRFLRKQEVDRTTYLVSTSAGAVGIDMDADAAIFDLCMLDGFIQRAGRINRAGGENRTASITLIYARNDFAKKDHPAEIGRPRLRKTLELLRQLPAKGDGLDASPDALSGLVMLPDYPDAATPLPRMRKLEDYLLDTWSMTTAKPRIGPEVSPWLRGISDDDPPQTTLVWRDLPNPLNDREAGNQLDDWLTALPLRVAEKSVIRTDRARKFLEALVARLDEAGAQLRIPVIGAHGDATTLPITELIKPSSRLAEATIILPAHLGGLSEDGFPEPSRTVSDIDVADQPGTRERWDLSLDESGWAAKACSKPLRSEPPITLEANSFDEAVSKLEKARSLRTARIEAPVSDSGDASDTTSARLYLVARKAAFPDDGESGAQTVKTQLLDKHLHLVGESARAIGEALGLDQSLIDQLTQAGAAHDRGKARPWWQQAAGNFSEHTLAKCYGRRTNWHRLHGYRHEFGSLLDLGSDGVDDDLVLHLVASHHGRARPGFDPRAFDSQHTLAENEQASFASEQRFDRLQRRYGWWGLAYLESLLKCADVMGSKETDA